MVEKIKSSIPVHDKKPIHKISMLKPKAVTVKIGEEVLFELNYHYFGATMTLKEEVLDVLRNDAEWIVEDIEYPVGELVTVHGDERVYSAPGTYIDSDCEGWDEAVAKAKGG